MITAIASGWMIRSLASRRASSAAAVAVASSGYPMAIRSAMVIVLSLVGDVSPPRLRRYPGVAIRIAVLVSGRGCAGGAPAPGLIAGFRRNAAACITPPGGDAGAGITLPQRRVLVPATFGACA